MKFSLLLMGIILSFHSITAGNSNDTLPFTFKAGDTARAASVNENFTYLLQSIRNTEANINQAKASIDSLKDATKSLNDGMRCSGTCGLALRSHAIRSSISDNCF